MSIAEYYLAGSVPTPAAPIPPDADLSTGTARDSWRSS
jgi:hypothetical protein